MNVVIMNRDVNTCFLGNNIDDDWLMIIHALYLTINSDQIDKNVIVELVETNYSRLQ